MNWVVLCAFNEGPLIRMLLFDVAEALEPLGPFELVVVDDGSEDHTAAEVRIASQYRQDLSFTLLRHEENQGLGAALATGFEHCLAKADPDDLIITLDADATHRPEQIPALIDAVGEDVDLAIASRFEPGAQVKGVPFHRRVLSDGARWVMESLLPIPGVRDYTCCFRAMRVGLLLRARDAFGPVMTDQTGFAAVPDLLLRMRPLGLRVREIPLRMDYGPRVSTSKMKVLSNVRNVSSLLLRHWREQRQNVFIGDAST